MIAATLSPVLGLICSLIAWLVTAKKQGGVRSFGSLKCFFLTSPNDEMCHGSLVLLRYVLQPNVYLRGEVLTPKSSIGPLRR